MLLIDRAVAQHPLALKKAIARAVGAICARPLRPLLIAHFGPAVCDCKFRVEPMSAGELGADVRVTTLGTSGAALALIESRRSAPAVRRGIPLARKRLPALKTDMLWPTRHAVV